MLHVDLQEGFEKDTVIVRVNRKEVFRKSDVSTRWQISLADTFEVNTVTAPALVEILLAEKNISGSVIIDGPWPAYVSFSVSRDLSILHRISASPFHYV